MKKIFILFFIFFLTQFSFAQENEYKGKMGYLTDGLNDIKYKNARIAFNLWVKELSSNNSVTADLIFYDDLDNFKANYEKSNFDYFTINPYYFLKYQDTFNGLSKELWIVKKSDDKFQEYIILTKKNSGINSIKDVKGKSFISREDDYVGRMILDNEVLKYHNKSSKSSLSSLTVTEKFSTAILKVYFGEIDICIVPAYALDIVSEMNPDIKRKVKVLYTSEKIFVPIITGFHNNANEILMDLFHESALNLEQSARGKNILNLFKMKQIMKIDKKDLNPLLEYYEKYQMIQDKYSLNKR